MRSAASINNREKKQRRVAGNSFPSAQERYRRNSICVTPRRKLFLWKYNASFESTRRSPSSVIPLCAFRAVLAALVYRVRYQRKEGGLRGGGTAGIEMKTEECYAAGAALRFSREGRKDLPSTKKKRSFCRGSTRTRSLLQGKRGKKLDGGGIFIHRSTSRRPGPRSLDSSTQTFVDCNGDGEHSISNNGSRNIGRAVRDVG